MQIKAETMNRLKSLMSSVSRSHAPLIARAIGGELIIDGARFLKTNVLGVNYEVKLANGDLKVDIYDPLGRGEDVSRLLTYVVNALERALQGKLAPSKKGLISLMQLAGGHAARLYEKKIIDFLTIEMDGSLREEVEKAVKDVGGVLVEHLSATWSFEVTPVDGVRVRIAFWQGEEGMPSGAAVLVGEEVKEIDVRIEELITMIEMIVNRFVLFYRRETGRPPRLFHSLYL
ncbi:MAG: DUF3786 domain-containing protein [Candidatus Nezhaarchaeales archaeon]|nr:DUF3786 domain-containing protein [Candidatus Nezhaarchaeota archaeon]